MTGSGEEARKHTIHAHEAAVQIICLRGAEIEGKTARHGGGVLGERREVWDDHTALLGGDDAGMNREHSDFGVF